MPPDGKRAPSIYMNVTHIMLLFLFLINFFQLQFTFRIVLVQSYSIVVRQSGLYKAFSLVLPVPAWRCTQLSQYLLTAFPTVLYVPVTVL